ncbi:hypothetical protein QJS66_20175 [Kocuria rhizophila]|nr:hypothetical protein QJS66_20175 [Kocuria rhizophila]
MMGEAGAWARSSAASLDADPQAGACDHGRGQGRQRRQGRRIDFRVTSAPTCTSWWRGKAPLGQGELHRDYGAALEVFVKPSASPEALRAGRGRRGHRVGPGIPVTERHEVDARRDPARRGALEVPRWA